MSLTLKELTNQLNALASQGYGDCPVDVEAVVTEDVNFINEDARRRGDHVIFPHTLQDVFAVEIIKGVVSIHARSYESVEVAR